MENIYELLNHAEMNLEEYENQKLSDYESKIVKKQVSKEVRKRKSSKKIWKKALAVAAACVCVMIGTGTIRAAAQWLPIPDSFHTIFGIHTEEELEVANMLGTSATAASENHGYKVSAEGVIGDGKNMGIVFKIEKSDGSALVNNGEVPKEVEFKEINHEDVWFRAMTGTVDGSNDADCIEYYITFTYKNTVKDHVFISMEDMQLWAGDGQIDIPGKWEFDLPFKVQDASVHLASGQKFEYGNSKGTIDELMVSPIGFSVRVTTTDPLSDSDFIDMPMEIHLKSGEVVELGGGCGPEDNGDGTWSWWEDGVYENMILIDHVKSVVIGDTEFAMK